MEKEATRTLDALTGRRRRLPMVPFDNSHRFESPVRMVTLLDVFEGRQQVAAYQFMDSPFPRPPCVGETHP